MSPPHRLKRRRKRENFDAGTEEEVMSQTQRRNQAAFMYWN